MRYIILFLGAIILANLSVAHFGPSSSIVNAFLFIGLDLTSRDKLHEAWHKRGLVWKMGLLIGAGSILSWLLNRNAGLIAIASFTAFACAAVVDTIVYQVLHEKAYLIKVNGSNVFSAAVDSLVFPTIAFGGFMPLITLGQFTAKVLGGFMWAILLRKITIHNWIWCSLFHSKYITETSWHIATIYKCSKCGTEWMHNPYMGS